MKISERSWHLRLARLACGQNYRPRDLCSYFWGGIVFSTAMICAVVVSLLVLASLLVRFMLLHLWETLGFLVVVLVVTGILLGVVWVFIRPPKDGPKGPPNPLVEYLRAKKRRLCPLIEVTP
jgi:hypothetical protein